MLTAIDAALAPGRLVLFGELHGTVEVPTFVAAAAARAAARGPVAVGIEWPGALQQHVDHRAGTPSSHPFWHWHDGRSSEAMARLIARVHALAGSVLCFDDAFADDVARDHGMAEAILAGMARRPEATWLVVCGNLHARSDVPRWMGWHLRARHPDLVALDLAHDGGTAWCVTDRGPGIHRFEADASPGPHGVTLHSRRDARGFDGVYRVGRITASPPIA